MLCLRLHEILQASEQNLYLQVLRQDCKGEELMKYFYVEMKNANGEYEPVGVMTMAKAIETSWEHDHASIQMQPIDMSYVLGAAGR
jgi:hypothetical protein